eukprot:6942841-Lingulodinium_polyedra.AAC.1
MELAALPGVEHVDFDQCRFGAPSTKPTRLLGWGVGLSRFKARCNHPVVWRQWTNGHGRPASGWRARQPL